MSEAYSEPPFSVPEMLKARALKASSNQTNNQLVVKSTSYVIYIVFILHSALIAYVA